MHLMEIGTSSILKGDEPYLVTFFAWYIILCRLTRLKLFAVKNTSKEPMINPKKDLELIFIC